MAYDGPVRQDERTSPSSRGLFGKLSDVIFDDMLGEATWIVVLFLAVGLIVGLTWVAAQLFG